MVLGWGRIGFAWMETWGGRGVCERIKVKEENGECVVGRIREGLGLGFVVGVRREGFIG